MNRIKIDQSRAQAGGHIVAGDLINNYPSPELADPRIVQEVETLRKRRWFAEYDRVGQGRILARRLQVGAFAAGTDEVRGRALALCARVLAGSDCLDESESLVAEARRLASSAEVEIAEAIILSKKGDEPAALALLAKLNLPAARSASLIVVALHEGAQGALSWVDRTALQPADFDPEGMFLLLSHQLEAGRWEAAAATARDIDAEENFDNCPIARFSVGIAYLLLSVPEEMRHVVRHQVPLQCKDFGLASDGAGADNRRQALDRFEAAAAQFAKELMLSAAHIAQEYALWLSLEDPTTNEQGRKWLRGALRKPEESLGWVSFAAQYGERLDVAAVEREIERQTALHGGYTPEAASARLSVALMQQSHAEVARYLAEHRDDLLKHIDSRAFAFIEIEMLAKSGQRELATERLSAAKSLNLSAEEEARLQHVVNESEEDVIPARMARFEDTDSLSDLVPLVEMLVNAEDQKYLSKYSCILFEKSRSLRSAEIFVESSIKSGQDTEALKLLDDYPNLLEQSKKLKLLKCWALYREGRLLEAKKALGDLSQHRESQNYKSLRQNIAAASGDWNEISAIVAEEHQHRHERSARELIQAAYLALQIQAHAARALLFAAAEKGKDDAAILASAYFLATSAGWEEDPVVARWLQTAADLSGDDGPLYRTSLQEILEKKPDWDRRESNTLKLLREGSVPMFLAAQSLNRSLLETFGIPFFANLSEDDPRCRAAIPAFSGGRPTQDVRLGSVVGLDATSLLTLGMLDLLDTLSRSVEHIRIPHSTLTWLLEEKQRAVFHQPSRVRSAQHLQDLLVRGDILEFAPTTSADSELSTQIGDDLAALIAEAHAPQNERERQHLVVRSAPVPRVGSLLEEEANLSEFEGILVSCQSIIHKLRQDGQVTAAEERKALAYLKLNEQDWPNAIEVHSGAVLYLDDLSVTYFQNIGLLDRLKRAGFKAVVAPSKAQESEALLAHQRLSEQMLNLIEKIRAFLQDGLTAHKVVVGPIREPDESSNDTREFVDHPTLGAIAFAGQCDAILIDDRYINQHLTAGKGRSVDCQVLTTLDFIRFSHAAGLIQGEDALELRSKLRRGGYIFIDVAEDEVLAQLLACDVKDGRVLETAELRSIRESILLVRMSGHLQVANELPWLDTMLKSLILALKRLWDQGEALEIVAARANWILPLLDLKGWLYCFEPSTALNILNDGRAAYLALLASPPLDADEVAISHYLSWVDESVFQPLKQQFPEVFTLVASMHKDMFETLWRTYQEVEAGGNG